MAEFVPFDAVEQILVRLAAKDIIRCKSVCKLWYALISSDRFVKYHLNYTCNKKDNEIGHRRIVMHGIPAGMTENMWYSCNYWMVVGSSNGLVCISPVMEQVLVINPSTREERKLTTPRIPDMSRWKLSWGFGYDSSIDDYKVVLGIDEDWKRTSFHVLTLKSNIWKYIGEVNFSCYSHFGTLYNGALHWVMDDVKNEKKVIMSFDLSSEEFKEIPQPVDSRYVSDYNDYSKRLGIFEDYLCIFHVNNLPNHKWVMKNYNVGHSWELLPYDCEMNKFDAAHTLKHHIPQKSFVCDDDDTCMSKTTKYIGAHTFVQSLVSPHVNFSRSFPFSHSILKKKRKRPAMNNKRNGKAIKGDCGSLNC